MAAQTHFPFLAWSWRKLTGTVARLTYAAVILIALSLTTAARIRTYFMVRRIQGVLHGLAEMRVDETNEDQLLKSLPHITRSPQERKALGRTQRFYHMEISNESDWLMAHMTAYPTNWLRLIADGLGYRFVSFDATLLVENGKVSNVSYGLAEEWVRPKPAGYVVSARSIHGLWLSYRRPFNVSSEEDESPQYRVEQGGFRPLFRGDQRTVKAVFTNDAPPELTRRAFQLDLSCFWSLQGCGDAREIAPGLWHDAEAIREATMKRLQAEQCPDTVIDGRMRYLPDVSVFLLEVTGSRQIEVNEEGTKTEDWFIDYELREEIRGHSSGPWKNVRLRRAIPSPADPTQTIATPIWSLPKIGSQVLFFGNLNFDSCRVIPATPSALAIAHKYAAPEERRPEDQILWGLQ